MTPRKAPTGPVDAVEIMRLRASVWSNKLGHPDPELIDGARPYWRPSKLGKCMVAHLLWRSGVPDSRVQTKSEEEAMYQRFSLGNTIEGEVRRDIELAGLLISKQLNLTDAELQVSGNVDLIWGGVVGPLPPQAWTWSPNYRAAVDALRLETLALIEARGMVPTTHTEIKSTGAWTVRQMKDQPLRADYRAQAGSYRLLMERNPTVVPTWPEPIERHEVLVLARDSMAPLRLEVTEADAQFALERLETLNAAWQDGPDSWPDCTCGQTEGLLWESKLCSYVGLDGSACCRRDDQLLRMLEASVDVTNARMLPASEPEPSLFGGGS